VKKGQKALRIVSVVALDLLFAALLTLPEFLREPLAWLPGWEYALTMFFTAVLWFIGLILLWPLYAHNKTPERKRKAMIRVVTLLVIAYALKAWANIEKNQKVEYLHSPNHVNAVVLNLKKVSEESDETYGFVTRVRGRFFYEIPYDGNENAIFVLSASEERTFTWIDDYTLAITHPIWGRGRQSDYSPGEIMTEYIRW